MLRSRSKGTASRTRETKTFDRRPAATAWIKRREHELQQPGALQASKVDDPPLAEAIDRYIQESRREIGRTKAQVLRAIKTDDIADRPCSAVTSSEIVAFARELSTGRKPQTVANYLAHLSAVLSIGRPGATRSNRVGWKRRSRSPSGSG